MTLCFIIILACVLIFALFAYYALSLAVVFYEVSIGERFRAALLSDLHGNDWGGENGALIGKIKASRPDVIFVTGDIVSRGEKDMDKAAAKMAALFRALSSVAPVYFVWGNHETSMPKQVRKKLQNALEGAGAKLLNNTLAQFRKTTICGVNEIDSEAMQSALRKLKNTDGAKLILNHFPQRAAKFEGKCGAMLCGHTHGGQVRLPFIGGVLVPGQGFFPKYDGGRFTIGKTTLVISRGLGDSVAPIRLFNRHELVIIDFE